MPKNDAYSYALVETHFYLGDPRFLDMSSGQRCAYLACWMLAVESRCARLAPQVDPRYIGLRARLDSRTVANMLGICCKNGLLERLPDGGLLVVGVQHKNSKVPWHKWGNGNINAPEPAQKCPSCLPTCLPTSSTPPAAPAPDGGNGSSITDADREKPAAFLDAWRTVYTEHFGKAPQAGHDHDLATLILANPTLTAERFATVLRWQWGRGKFAKGASLTLVRVAAEWEEIEGRYMQDVEVAAKQAEAEKGTRL